MAKFCVLPFFSRSQPKTSDRFFRCYAITRYFKRHQSISTVIVTSTRGYLADDIFSSRFLFRRPATGMRYAYRISLIFVGSAPADRHSIRDLSCAACRNQHKTYRIDKPSVWYGGPGSERGPAGSGCTSGSVERRRPAWRNVIARYRRTSIGEKYQQSVTRRTQS